MEASKVLGRKRSVRCDSNPKLVLVPNYGVSVLDGNILGNPDQVRLVRELQDELHDVGLATTILMPLRSSHVPFQSREVSAPKFCSLGDWPEKIGRLTKIRTYLASIHKLQSFIRAYDWVYVFFPGYNALIASVLALIMGKQLGIYVRGGLEHAGSDFRSMYLFAARKAQFVLCTGLELRRQLRASRVNAELVAPMIFGNAAPAPASREKRGSNEKGKKDLHLLFVGSVNREKGIFDFFRATAYVIERGVNVQVRIIGDLRESIRVDFERELEKIRSRADVRYEGFVSSEEVLEAAYNWADVLVFPSYNEGFPRVVYEAMLYACAVIMYELPGVAGFLQHEKNSLLAAKGRISEFSELLYRVCTDDDMRNGLVKNAKRDVDNLLRETKGMSHGAQILGNIRKTAPAK